MEKGDMVALFFIALSATIIQLDAKSVAKRGQGQLGEVLPISESDKTNILTEHNGYRKQALSTMQDLEYDDSLATEALDWAKECYFKHPDNLNSGQNIWMGTADDFPTESWHSEIQYYDYDNNVCAAGQQCGHYTQVVWETAQKIGCGHVKCSSLQMKYSSPVQNAYVWVCNYNVGNVGEGGMYGVPLTVYRPYTKEGWTGGYTAAHPDLTGCNDNVAYCGANKWITSSDCNGNGIYTVNGRQKSAKGFCPKLCDDCTETSGVTGGSTNANDHAGSSDSTHGGRGQSSTHGDRGESTTTNDCDDNTSFCGPGKFIPLEDCNGPYTYTISGKSGPAVTFCPTQCGKSGC